MTRKKQKRREEDEVETLQKEVRELKAVNRSLMKRLKKVDREYAEQIEKINQEIAVREHDSGGEITRSIPCEHCGKGRIEEIDIVGRKFEKCTVCDYRRKVPKKG